MFVIVAASKAGEAIRATRLREASAAVLAMKLASEGCTDVAIMDRKGARMSLGQFQRKHLRSRHGFELGSTF